MIASISYLKIDFQTCTFILLFSVFHFQTCFLFTFFNFEVRRCRFEEGNICLSLVVGFKLQSPARAWTRKFEEDPGSWNSLFWRPAEPNEAKTQPPGGAIPRRAWRNKASKEFSKIFPYIPLVWTVAEQKSIILCSFYFGFVCSICKIRLFWINLHLSFFIWK